MSALPCLSETVLDRLFRHARAFPECPAYRYLREDGGSDMLTFGQLAGRVRALATWLQGEAASGSRVLLLYPPGLPFIEAFLACLAAGVIAIPAAPPRPNRPAATLRAILEDADPTLVITARSSAAAVAASLAALGATLPVRASDEAGSGADGSGRLAALGPDTVAFLQFTSGSTGSPRGVVVTHGQLVANEQQIERSFGHISWAGGNRHSVVISWLPLFHDMGLVGDVLQPLYVGCPAVRMSPVAFLREPVRWLRAISEYRGTTSGAPNFAYDFCVEHITAEQKKGLDLSSWRVAYNGAEPVRAETLNRFAAAFACCGFRCEAFFPCYGMAEATLFVSGGPADRPPTCITVSAAALEADRRVRAPAAGESVRRLVSCGRPAEHVRLAIIDPESGGECSPDQGGEVWVSSPSVAQGYWNRPEQTLEVFRAVHADGTGPFLRTGDAGFLLDGELYITGRLKDLIIIRGRNLDPQEIEAAVARVVPCARANACAAFAIDVDGAERLVIVIEADRDLARLTRGTDSEGRLADLVGGVRECVGTLFEVSVHAVIVLRPGTLPRTSSGKVRRRVCRAGLLGGELSVLFTWQAGQGGLSGAAGNGQERKMPCE